MAAITAPYRADAEMLLRDRAQHLNRIWAYKPGQDPYEVGTRLELIEGALTIDEDASPRFAFNGIVADVEDMVSLLDPRTGTRFLVELGYRYPDGRTEVFPVVDLVLISASRSLKDRTITFNAVSDEKIVMNYVDGSAITFPADTARSTALYSLLRRGNNEPVTVRAWGAGGSIGSEPLVVDPANVWDAINSLADESGAVVYHDGLTGFYVDEQNVTPNTSAANLKTGRQGTITDGQISVDRTGFANYVLVVLSWTDAAGTDHTVYGSAEQLTGPYATSVLGRIGTVIEVKRSGSVASAQAQASNVLVRTLTRGQQMHIEDSMARYWLRPGHTVSVQLGALPERYFVTRVDFDLPSGTMALDLRKPE